MTRHLLALSTWQPIPYIAADTGINEQTIRTWIRRGKVKVRRIDGQLVANRSDIDQLAKARSRARRLRG